MGAVLKGLRNRSPWCAAHCAWDRNVLGGCREGCVGVGVIVVMGGVLEVLAVRVGVLELFLVGAVMMVMRMRRRMVM